MRWVMGCARKTMGEEEGVWKEETPSEEEQLVEAQLSRRVYFTG